MIIQTLINELDSLFPLELQEPYDNTGGQIVFGEEEISGILVSLDISRSVIDEAKERGCNLIISHHPFLFKPLKHIVSSEPHSAAALDCIYSRISLYAAHTNLDRVFWQKLGESLGFKPSAILLKGKIGEDGFKTGFGSLSETQNPITFEALLKRVKDGLGLDYCLYAGGEKPVKTIAFLNGAGGGSIDEVIRTHNPDCIITGDVNYHNAMSAIENGISIIDAGHYGTERVLLKFLMEAVGECLTKAGAKENTLLCLSEREENPFKVFY